MATTVAARKAKGMRLQKWVVQELLNMFKLTENDARSIPGSVPGPDIWLSQTAIDKVGNWDFECKNQEKLSIWAALNQLFIRDNGKQKALIFSRNKEKNIYVTITLTQFLILLYFQYKLMETKQHE